MIVLAVINIRGFSANNLSRNWSKFLHTLPNLLQATAAPQIIRCLSSFTRIWVGVVDQLETVLKPWFSALCESLVNYQTLIKNLQPRPNFVSLGEGGRGAVIELDFCKCNELWTLWTPHQPPSLGAEQLNCATPTKIGEKRHFMMLLDNLWLAKYNHHITCNRAFLFSNTNQKTKEYAG